MNEDRRTQFEAWVDDPKRGWNLERSHTFPGEHRNYAVQLAWDAWQAAAERKAVMDNPSPLQLASGDDLIAELKSRYEACLVVLLKEQPGQERFGIIYKRLTTCIGLAERARARLVQKALDLPREGESDEA